MRTVFFFVFWLFIATCYGLEVIASESPVIDARTYLKDHTHDEVNIIALNQSEEFPLPVRSLIRAGTLKAHRVTNNVISQPLFVVGDDALSRRWLKKQAKKLQALHAVGFVTNISTSKALHELNQLANVPLQAVDVDELAHLLKVTHYPFVLEEGVVWQ
jgi:integrating conjugative element protein (TIGR03765 family)